MVFGYIGLILTGSLFLLIPGTHRGNLNFTDSFFTSASAVCVTGLIVKDTAHFFTPLGKAIILVLIQIGGLGYMTFTTFFLFIFRSKTSLRFRVLASQSFPELSMGNIFGFMKRVIFITLVIEAIGTMLLYTQFRYAYGASKAIWHAVFNSISAFCNAGFSTFANSLSNYVDNPVVVFTIVLLIIAGGIGFYVYIDYYYKIFKKEKSKVSLHTKAVLSYTLWLIASGFVVFLLLEWNGAFARLSFGGKMLAALFQSVTPRTAGFSTIDQSLLSPATIIVTSLFMFIGGSPGGTAGGIKTTTFFGVFLWLKSFIRGRKDIILFKNKLPEQAIRRVFAILFLSIGVVIVIILLLSITEASGIVRHGILPYIFEVFSAFGTVGLSRGSFSASYVSLSYDFSILGKWLIILTMLIGKVGVLSTVYAVLLKDSIDISYPEGSYVVG